MLAAKLKMNHPNHRQGDAVNFSGGEFMEDFVVAHDNPRQAALWGYIAGIIDGEGSIRINSGRPSPRSGRKTNYYHAQINLGMVEKKIPLLLKHVFKAGNVREERVPGRRSIWRYSLTGNEQLLRVLYNLLPYLVIKEKHAKVAIDFCEGWVVPKARKNGVDPQELQRREDAFQIMRKLNAVGAAATTNRVGTREGEVIV